MVECSVIAKDDVAVVSKLIENSGLVVVGLQEGEGILMEKVQQIADEYNRKVVVVKRNAYMLGWKASA